MPARDRGWPSRCGSLFEQSRRRGVLLLMAISWWTTWTRCLRPLRLFRHRGWEVIVLHLVHPDEERLPDGSAFRFEGMEDDGQVTCSPAEIRAAYQRAFCGPRGDGPPVGPGRRLRLPPRIHGDSILADAGRIPGRTGGLNETNDE